MIQPFTHIRKQPSLKYKTGVGFSPTLTLAL